MDSTHVGIPVRDAISHVVPPIRDAHRDYDLEIAVHVYPQQRRDHVPLMKCYLYQDIMSRII